MDRAGKRHRWRLITTAAVVIVASLTGCAGHDGRAAGGGATSTTTVTADASTAPAGPATTGGVAGGPATDATTSPKGAAASAPPADAIPALGGPGSFAGRYLRPSESSRITVAELMQPGAEPQPGTLEHVQSVLQQASGKPVEINTITIGGGAESWTSTSLAAVVDRQAPPQTADTAVLSILFVHGDYGGDTSILGVASRGDVAAVFVDQLSGSAGLLGSVAPIEKAVSTHEVGHLLGLVDLWLHTGRQDPEHPGHSRDQASVMYWAVESNLVGQVLGADPPTEFDAADQADLATIRAS